MTKLYDILSWKEFMHIYKKLINSSNYCNLISTISLEMIELGWTAYIKKFADKAMERNEDPQQCLNLLFDTIFSFENEEMYFDECLFDVFLDNGAIFPTDKLFEPKHKFTSYTIIVPSVGTIERKLTLYDEVEMYLFRGLIIDYLGSRNLIDHKKYAKWHNIKAKKLEKNEIYDEITEKRRLQILKYCSKYLRSINKIYIAI